MHIFMYEIRVHGIHTVYIKVVMLHQKGLYLHLLFLKGCIFFTKNCNVVVDVNKFCFYVSDENNNMCLLCMLFVFQLSNYYPLDEKKS